MSLIYFTWISMLTHTDKISLKLHEPKRKSQNLWRLFCLISDYSQSRTHSLWQEHYYIFHLMKSASKSKLALLRYISSCFEKFSLKLVQINNRKSTKLRTLCQGSVYFRLRDWYLTASNDSILDDAIIYMRFYFQIIVCMFCWCR